MSTPEEPETQAPAEEAAEPRAPAGDRLAAVEEIELTIDQLVEGGAGLGRFEGIPIFVPRSAPGDRLKVQLIDRKPGYGRAEIVSVLEPGPGRREPPCPYFSDCGGCDLQHLEDAVQVRLKAQALHETLKRVGRLENLPKIRIRAAQSWAYRLRTQLHTEVSDEGKVSIGYHARGSNRLVAVDRCPILVPELEGELLTLASRLGGSTTVEAAAGDAAGGEAAAGEAAAGEAAVVKAAVVEAAVVEAAVVEAAVVKASDEEPKTTPRRVPKRLDLAAGDDGAVTAAPVIEALPKGAVTTRVGKLVYAYDARVFFQAHRGLLAALVEETVGEHRGSLAFDLYSGVGLFSLPLAERYQRVVAVESERGAVRYARNNARRNKKGNIESVAQMVERWIRSAPGKPDRVVLDPPRNGLSIEVGSALLRLQPERLTYVSCHPAALARDLKRLSKRYRIESIAALDLFPQTGHLETVVQLVRR